MVPTLAYGPLRILDNCVDVGLGRPSPQSLALTYGGLRPLELVQQRPRPWHWDCQWPTTTLPDGLALAQCLCLGVGIVQPSSRVDGVGLGGPCLIVQCRPRAASCLPLCNEQDLAL